MTILEQIKKLRERQQEIVDRRDGSPLGDIADLCAVHRDSSQLLLSPQLTSELEELERLRSGLLKTRDGICVRPGIDIVYFEDLHGYVDEEWSLHPRNGVATLKHPTEDRRVKVTDCYSTHEAAEAALKREKR